MKRRIPIILLILFSTIFILSFYRNVIIHPNSYLFNNEGDAIKNYFTFNYHIKHDNSYSNFGGMNYPYGENILYTDCHPVLANFLKLLASDFSFFSDYSIGILNFLMLFSIFITFIICYILLREFGLSAWFSLLFSIGITMLSPQIFRLGGHLALSYSIAIPLSWLYIIRSLSNTDKLFYPVVLFTNNIFWLFIHAYLGVIIIFFLFLIIAGKFIIDKLRRTHIGYYVRVLSAVILPLILFYIFTLLTDTHTGRTDNPSGFFLYTAEFDDIFLPHHLPLSQLFDALTGNIIRQQWEAWSYVGMTTTLIFITILFLAVIKLFNRSKTTLEGIFFKNMILNISLASAFIVLLFAMAFPFKQIPWLLDIFPLLKQFRATGRFAWPFFFVSTVFAAVAIQEIYIKSIMTRWKTVTIVFCILAGSFNIIEGIPYHLEVSKTISKSKNLFRKEHLPASFLTAINTVNPDDYQAIIPLPFFYQGSESYSRPRNDETVRSAILISYHTGIPITGANLTRTSIRESKNIVQLVSPDFYKKEIRSDLPDNRPFLVIRTKAVITDYEKEIFGKCTPLYLSEDISVYNLTKEELFKNSAQCIYNKYEQLKPELVKRNQFYVTNDSSFLFYTGFEELKSDKSFRGNGAFQSVKAGKNKFAEFDPYTFSAGTKYKVSIWMFNGSKDALNDWFRLIIEEFDVDKNEWHTTTFFPEYSEVINGDWSLAEGTFEVKNPKNKVYIVTKGKDGSKGPFYADDLLIKEDEIDIYYMNSNDGRLFYNNHDIVVR